MRLRRENNVFTSANYLSELLFEKAGMKLLPYQDFLKGLREEIPAIVETPGVIRTETGKPWIKNSRSCRNIGQLQYRNMFDKKIHY